MTKKCIAILCVFVSICILYYVTKSFIHDPKVAPIQVAPIQIAFTFDKNENGAVSVEGNYFRTKPPTTKEEAVETVGVRQIIEGKEYSGSRIRKGRHSDDLAESSDYDCQYLRRYSKSDNSYYFFLNTKICTQLEVSGHEEYTFLDMTNNRTYKGKQMTFTPGAYKVAIRENETGGRPLQDRK